jgi:hypothetical protein
MKNYKVQYFKKSCEKCKFSIFFTGDNYNNEIWYCNIEKKLTQTLDHYIDPNGICDLFESIK